MSKPKNFTDNGYKNGHRKTLKSFGIISSLIFAVIVVSSFIWLQSSDRSTSVFIQVINIIILSSGVIGLGYCIIMLRTFDVKTDNIVTEKLIDDLDLNDNNNGAQSDNNNMTWENSKDKDKERLICF